jgi:uncharacterized membrane protein (UPF0182 family)
VIPIENSFLYVVPLYLKAEGTNFPQLKRVIVATGDKVVMEPTLDEALSLLVWNKPVWAAVATAGKRPGRKDSCQPSSSAGSSQGRQLAEAQKAINSLKESIILAFLRSRPSAHPVLERIRVGIAARGSGLRILARPWRQPASADRCPVA